MRKFYKCVNLDCRKKKLPLIALHPARIQDVGAKCYVDAKKPFGSVDLTTIEDLLLNLTNDDLYVSDKKLVTEICLNQAETATVEEGAGNVVVKQFITSIVADPETKIVKNVETEVAEQIEIVEQIKTC